MDDAGGGRRGPKPSISAELVAFVTANWGLRPTATAVELGGSVNLNVLVDDGTTAAVARVYRSHVKDGRLECVQTVRRHLAAGGLPFVAPAPTVDGVGWDDFGGHLVEVEPFVASDARMNTLDRLIRALPTLGQVHDRLSHLPEGLEMPDPEFSNYLPARAVRTATAEGTARIRSWNPTPSEDRLADDADTLAERLSALSASRPALPEQLVHGDYWDNNVLFAGDEIALVTDLDFLGRRPRTDDLALTLYFTSLDIVDITSAPGLLRDLVDRYESGLAQPLSEDERLDIPVALARQPLWSIGVWVAQLDDEATARSHLAGTADALRWGAAVADDCERLQATLLASR